MDILSLALAFYRTPIARTSLSRLPIGIDALLRIAGGNPQQTETAVQLTGADAAELREAAIFFIQQVFFARDADHYRLLGLNPGAPLPQIKEHHRLLMRLFHPDRQDTALAWSEMYAGRVNEAYNVLRRSETRRDYDAQQTNLARSAPPSAPPPPSPFGYNTPNWTGAAPIQHDTLPLHLPRFMMRNLPQTVLGGLAVLALLFVAGLYLSHQPTANIAADAPVPLPAPAPAPATTAQAVPVAPVAPVAPPEPALPNPIPLPTLTPSTPVATPSTEPVPVATAPVVPATPKPSAPATSAADTTVVVTAASPTPAVVAETTPTKPPLPANKPPSPAISDMDLEVLTSLFIGAYERGNLDELMTLFDDQARANDTQGKANIRRDYQMLFKGTRDRQMKLTDLHWDRNGLSARGHGLFEVRLRGERGYRNLAGTIRFEVRKQRGALRISGLQHRELYHKFE